MNLSNKAEAEFRRLSHERYHSYRSISDLSLTMTVFLRKYNNRLQIGRSLRRPAQSVVSSLNHI